MPNISQKERLEISKKCKEENITQPQIAKEANCTVRYVRMVFSGERNSTKVILAAKQLLADKSNKDFKSAIKRQHSILQVL